MPRNDRIENRRDMMGGLVVVPDDQAPSEAQIEAAIVEHLRRKRIAVVDAGAVTPYVNHSRWVADCACGSGLACSPGIDRATCMECGARYEVVWPDDDERADVESVLLARPRGNSRNWSPGDKVADLVAENVARGVAVPKALRTVERVEAPSEEVTRG
jgi:hypothetical protein